MSPVTDSVKLHPGNLEETWRYLKEELTNHDPKLSPIRAGELAAARLREQISNRLADIDGRARTGSITAEEERFYDSIYMDGWSYSRSLERLSGSRTLSLDADYPYVQRPLDATPLENILAKQQAETEQNRAVAEEVARCVASERASRAADSKAKGEEFRRQQREATERMMQMATEWAKTSGKRKV